MRLPSTPGRMSGRFDGPLRLSLAAVLVACGGGGATVDEGDASMDAAIDIAAPDPRIPDSGTPDVGIDERVEDTRVEPDVSMDAGVDATDVAVDMRPACDCPAPTECLAYECDPEVGECLPRPTAFGTLCGETPMGFPEGRCSLEGSCAPRTCGDGFVEPAFLLGPGFEDTGPAQEACDSGNEEGQGACTETCELVPVPVVSEPVDFEDPDAPISRVDLRAGRASVAADDAGRLLFVWRSNDAPNPSRARALRRTAGGATLPEGAGASADSFEFPGVGTNPAPVVIGLPHGWAVAYNESDGMRLALVPPDGEATTLRILIPKGQSSFNDPRLARFTMDDGRVGLVLLAGGTADLLAIRFTVEGAAPGPAAYESADETSVGRTGTLRRLDTDPFLVDVARRPGGPLPPVVDYQVAGSGPDVAFVWADTVLAPTFPRPRRPYVKRFHLGGATPRALDSAPIDLASGIPGDRAPDDAESPLSNTLAPNVIGVGVLDESTSPDPSTARGAFAIAFTHQSAAGEPSRLFARAVLPSEPLGTPLLLDDGLDPADPAERRRPQNPTLAPIPAVPPFERSEAAPTNTPAAVSPPTAQALIAWEQGSRPESIALATVSVTATPSVAPTPDATTFTTRLFTSRTYEGGLHLTATAPAAQTRGTWMAAAAFPIDSDAENELMAFLLPVVAPELTP